MGYKIFIIKFSIGYYDRYSYTLQQRYIYYIIMLYGTHLNLAYAEYPTRRRFAAAL